ncbi:MAG: glucose-1-phosphate adenylyltransferase subunit GlgD [Erysipelotrichaceae bacterium]|nr:glucose-1-phosphate adenylyltransferase subunit GlgD [Erysipelotrichaceae bacterium]
MIDALGIVSFGNDAIRVEGLMDYRPISAISFLGRYRMIDFVISNMTNSGIENIKVFVKKQPRSLIEQLGTGRHYNINSKRGGLQILYGETDDMTSGIYNHDVSAYKANKEFIEDAKQEYVIIAPGYMVYSINFEEVLKAHKESHADVTVVYKSIDTANENFFGCTTLELDDAKRITGTAVNMGRYKNRNVSLDTYVMTRKLFLDLVDEASRISSLYMFRDILRDCVEPLNVVGYAYKGYCACINSLPAYYNASMELIDHKVAKDLFKPGWPIYTRTNDSVPAYYGEDAKVTNCLIANGCRIEGELENCVLGRGVTVKKGCKIKNAVILPETYIGEDTTIEYAVVDKKVVVKSVKEIKGTETAPAYIKRRDRI